MNMRLVVRLFGFYLLLMSSSSFALVKYVLDVDQPEHHLASVKAEFSQLQGEHLALRLPAWRTGRYKILNLANGLRQFTVINEAGEQLPFKKTDKQTWLVELKGAKDIIIKYRVYAKQLSDRSRHIDDSHAFINASGYFVYSDQSREQQVRVDLNLPKGWDSISGMESGPNSHSYIAENYDVLVDSPIEAGIFEHHQFKVEGIAYELAIWGRGNFNSKQMADDLAKMVKSASSIWDSAPFKRYVFIVHATNDVRGATEHINSTIIQRKRFTFAPRDQYLEFLATAAHEYVHTWNVKAYRAKGLVPYDYEKENYTPLLWLEEGSTSYFQYHLLLRAGLISLDEYFQVLAKEIMEHEHTPGRMQQSLAQASFDKWIASSGDRAVNASVGIYDEGALVSLLLDLDLIIQSNGKVNYRQVHNALYKQFSLPNSFNDHDVKQVLSQLSGKDYQQWWDKFIDKPVSLNFTEVLDKVGLEINELESAVDIGIKVIAKEGMTLVAEVEQNSAAWRAGLTPGDIILAIDGLRVYADTCLSRIEQAKKADFVTMTIFRRDELLERMVSMPKRSATRYKIDFVDDPNSSQKRLFEAWLDRSHPKS